MANAAAYGGTVAVAGFWLLRNPALTGTLMGPRVASNVSLTENIGRTGRQVAQFFLPNGKAVLLPGVV